MSLTSSKPADFPIRRIEVAPFNNQIEIIDGIISSNSKYSLNHPNNGSNRSSYLNYHSNRNSHYNSNNHKNKGNNNNDYNHQSSNQQNKYALATVAAAAAVQQQHNYMAQQPTPQSRSHSISHPISYQPPQQQHHHHHHQQHQPQVFNGNSQRFKGSSTSSSNSTSGTLVDSGLFNYDNSKYLNMNMSTPTIQSSSPTSSSTQLTSSHPNHANLLGQSQSFDQQQLDSVKNSHLLDNLNYNLNNSNLLLNPTSTSTNSPPNLFLNTSNPNPFNNSNLKNNFLNSPSLLPTNNAWNLNPSPTNSQTPLKSSSIWSSSFDSNPSPLQPLSTSKSTLSAFNSNSNNQFGGSSMW